MNTTLRNSLIVFGVFLLGLIVDATMRPAPPDVKHWENRVEAYQADSVRSEHVIAMLYGTVAREKARGDSLSAVAGALKQRADGFSRAGAYERKRADSLIVLLGVTNTAQDSLVVMTNAYEARTAEAVELRAEVGSLRDAFAAQQQATARLAVALVASDSVANQLSKRLAIADDLIRDRPQPERCRILWMACPSRTTTFVVGAVAGLAGGLYVATR